MRHQTRLFGGRTFRVKLAENIRIRYQNLHNQSVIDLVLQKITHSNLNFALPEENSVKFRQLRVSAHPNKAYVYLTVRWNFSFHTDFNQAMDNLVTDYYHGKLDRRAAEERLGHKGRVGSFLLRESDRKAGSFVLSYYGRTGINHFRITHVYGSYFIGGRQFDSLSDLIEYYSTSCDLLIDERLLEPIPPPEPVASKDRLFISILPYTKLAQSDELSFKKGDMFILQNDLGDGWLWCRSVNTGQSGMVFSHLVEEIHEDIDPNEVFPWFHAHLSKTDAVNKLAEAGPGSFLVRPSENSPGNYTLFYHVGSTVQRFLIIRTGESRYTMGGKCFDSLNQIVDLYQREQIIEGHVLQFPVTTTTSRADQLRERTLSTSMRALRVKEKPEDVYNTVKISREAAKQKQSHEVKGWLSLKKGNIHKKWKTYFFVLNSRDRHLYFYEKPQQTKPKGLIDLTYSYIYCSHETLFNWPQCFQLIEKCLPCFANHFFLKCDSERRVFDRWIGAIKKFTSSNQSNKRSVDALIDLNRDSTSNGRQDTFSTTGDSVIEDKRSIYMDFMEVNSVKVSQPYFVISYNQDIKMARTQVKTSPTAIFGEDGHFAFEDLPADVKTLDICIHQHNKKPKAAIDLAHLSIDISRLSRDSDKLDKWFEFRSTHSPEVCGYLRLKVHYYEDIVMGLSEYAALEDLICDPNTEIISLLDQFCHRDHLTLARALSNIFRYKKTSTRILKSIIEREASLELDTAALFRTSSLTTALIETYMRSMCQTALINCLTEPIKKLINDKICCELNPSRLESYNVSQKACENLQNLLDLLDELVSNIYDSVSYYPSAVRYLFACLQKIVQSRWPNEPLIRTRVVSGFLFLRLICPTILNPKQFNLINETLSENAIRNLTLVAKCLQNLANLVETSKSNNSLAQSILSTLDDYAIYPLNQSTSSNQADYSAQTNSILAFILSPQIESWMEVVNPFILKNKIGMVKFIDELCNVEFTDPIYVDRPDLIDGNNNGGSCYSAHLEDDIQDPSQALAIVHDICESYRNQIEQLAPSSKSAKKLSTILTILTKHKQYYINLRKCST